MTDFEKLGVFYLGRETDPAGKALGEPVLYDSRHLVTHALCVGMTGSGKTGLCLSLIEEAAIDGVPTIAIDPKGDLSNLLLTFPRLAPEDFRPWIDEDEARRAGPDAGCVCRAAGGRPGRRGSPTGARTAPGSSGCAPRPTSPSTRPAAAPGLPLSILSSFGAPPQGAGRRRRWRSGRPRPRWGC